MKNEKCCCLLGKTAMEACMSSTSRREASGPNRSMSDYLGPCSRQLWKVGRSSSRY